MSQEELALKEFNEAKDALKSLAKRQFTPSTCPLRHDHHELSQALWGLGCFWWNCEFCGEEHNE
jgi:hypothetical protein